MNEMGLFKKFSMPSSFSKKRELEGLIEPRYSPIIGQATSYKTLATFDLQVEKPKYEGDIPDATITFYQDLS